MDINELYLKTAFCCMACDGDIAGEEVALLGRVVSESKLFSGIDVQTKVNEYVESINKEGNGFLSNYLREITSAELNDEQALSLVKLAIDTLRQIITLNIRKLVSLRKSESALLLLMQQFLRPCQIWKTICFQMLRFLMIWIGRYRLMQLL